MNQSFAPRNTVHGKPFTRASLRETRFMASCSPESCPLQRLGTVTGKPGSSRSPEFRFAKHGSWQTKVYQMIRRFSFFSNFKFPFSSFKFQQLTHCFLSG